MLWRILHIVQKLVGFMFTVLCTICRCKKKKTKVKDDEMMPTEIVIGDARPSQTAYIEPVHINTPVVPAYNEVENEAMEEWNSWGNEDKQKQIEKEPDADNMNFFENMEPTVKVKKVFVKKTRREKHSIGNMLAVRSDNDIQLSNELGAWNDDEMEEQSAGWEEEDVDINCDQIAAEAKAMKMQERKKKTEEQRRMKQMKKQRENHQQHKLGMKVS